MAYWVESYALWLVIAILLSMLLAVAAIFGWILARAAAAAQRRAAVVAHLLVLQLTDRRLPLSDSHHRASHV